MRLACLLGSVILPVLLIAVVHADEMRQDSRLVPWTNRPINDRPEDFHFAIVGDRAGGTRPGIFEQTLQQVELLQPAFVLCVGDLVNGGVASEQELDRQFEELDGLLDRLTMPFYRVTGNHDIDNTPFGKEVWQRRYGQLYYHFLYKDALFLCLSSDEGGGKRLSDEQVAYVRGVLDENAGVRWTFVFVHHPLWTYENETNWEGVEAALKGRPYTVFAGHTHEYLKYDRLGRDYVVLATSGGGSGAHEGPVAGEFDHVVWVSMVGSEPRVVNLLSEGIKDKNVRTDSGAALLEPLLSGEAVSVSPLRVDDGPFVRGTVTLTLRNPADIPLSVLGVLHPSGQMRPSLTRIETTIPPRSTQTYDVEIEALVAVGLRALQPLTTKWRLTYAGDLTAEYVLRICPETVHACPKRTSPVNVDGVLDEWRGRPFRCLTPAQVLPNGQNWNGAGDCSFGFHVSHDDTYVYLALRVVDDAHWVDSAQAPWKQDGVQIRLDARADPERSSGQGEEDRQQTRHLFVALSPTERPEHPHVFNEDALPEGVEAACARTASGFDAEVAIPRAYLDAKQEGDAQAFRLNVTVSDCDSAIDTGSQLWWRPSWSRNENVPGSGTFRLTE